MKKYILPIVVFVLIESLGFIAMFLDGKPFRCQDHAYILAGASLIAGILTAMVASMSD